MDGVPRTWNVCTGRGARVGTGTTGANVNHARWNGWITQPPLTCDTPPQLGSRRRHSACHTAQQRATGPSWIPSPVPTRVSPVRHGSHREPAAVTVRPIQCRSTRQSPSDVTTSPPALSLIGLDRTTAPRQRPMRQRITCQDITGAPSREPGRHRRYHPPSPPSHVQFFRGSVQTHP